LRRIVVDRFVPLVVSTRRGRPRKKRPAILAQIPGVRVGEGPQQVMRLLYPAGLPTATNSKRSRLQAGLHVDIWEGLGWRHSWKGGNRISSNMSRSVRYFVLVPIQACRLASKLIQGNAALDDSNFDLAAEYLRLQPQAILYRLRVNPGGAYIAPTENLIDDGIPARSHVDDTLVIRGRFEIGC
jgi:hypothetical protein